MGHIIDRMDWPILIRTVCLFYCAAAAIAYMKVPVYAPLELH
jgi:hypothetical protein